ncbi:MAG: sigma-54 dependent transcriptional regulator [Acidobacteriota bacterium]
MPSVLIVDDEKHIRSVLRLLLEKQGYAVRTASSGEEAVALFEREPAEAALLDLKLPGIDGLETMTRLQRLGAPCAFIMMTAHGTIQSAVRAVRQGAHDYITKPFDNDELLLTLGRALEYERLRAELRELRRELKTRYGLDRMVGAGPGMRAVFDAIERVSRVDATVLITGESGTGKELAARAIHEASARAAGPFLTVNCGAVPVTLFESEFFGHERGAFTDAREARPGKFEQASGGILFLDEVGELPLEAQVKLLRVLEDHAVTRIGAGRPVPVDVRVIAATNRRLEDAVRAGAFREDLFYRLNVFALELPPLRQRRQDIPALVRHLLAKMNAQLKLEIEGISPEALRMLEEYAWPGNVRELENALCQAMIYSNGRRIEPADLPARIGPARLRPAGTRPAPPRAGNLAEAVEAVVAQVEREMIVKRLAQCRGHRTAAAESLGISRKTLFNKMRQYGLPAAEENEDSNPLPPRKTGSH